MNSNKHFLSTHHLIPISSWCAGTEARNVDERRIIAILIRSAEPEQTMKNGNSEFPTPILSFR